MTLSTRARRLQTCRSNLAQMLLGEFIQATRRHILEAIPPGSAVARHTEHEHFYEIIPLGTPEKPVVFPSYTGSLQMLKDESLKNYAVNRMADYIFGHFHEMNDDNLMEHLDQAKLVPAGILQDAGDVGTRIHDARQRYFDAWIARIEAGGQPLFQPDDLSQYLATGETDGRVISGLRGVASFCEMQLYIPVVCELKVWNKKYEVAGTLDDIGYLCTRTPGDLNAHPGKFCEWMSGPGKRGRPSMLRHRFHCVECGAKLDLVLTMLDLKSSNRFKDHYFLQVTGYWDAFATLTKLKPPKNLILKVSKEDGSYKTEDMGDMRPLVKASRHQLALWHGLQHIKRVRTDNGKVVATIT